MSKIHTSVDQLIGGTPLLELTNIEKELGLCAKVIAKLEYLNPAGSSKDRVGRAMIERAEASGELVDGSVIIEPTSGNTGIGLAMVAAVKGYRVIIVMPDNMSVERIQILKAYGAELILTPAEEGMAGAIKKAEEVAKTIPNSFIAGQLENPANPKAHYDTTGPEIYRDTDGKVDIFVAGIGTGGTISGTGRYLKEKCENVEIVGVEPANSAVLSGGTVGAHGLQGIGAGFIPKALDTEVYDSLMTVTEDQAYEMGRLLGRKEGILCGISSGAALWAAVELAKKPENKGKNIVVLLPDTGDRYLSTPLFCI
ncbi:MAG: cysteine synthase A [Clostridia bacterium]|nr:cysteine synthase A [Clostridia bacterium]